MTAAIAEACAELARWLPAAQALTATPDTDHATGRTQPASRPPWNQAAATALYSALEDTRRLEAAWRSEAARRPVPLRPVCHTGLVLISLTRLAERVPEASCAEAAILLTRHATAIMQLPAVDEIDPARKIPGTCPYCGYPVLLARVQERRVACPRGGTRVCADADGNPPRGRLEHDPRDGTPRIEWNDGLVT